MLKKFTAIVFLLTFAFLAQASAQTIVAPEKQAAIKELVGLIIADNRAEEMVRAMTSQVKLLHEATIEEVIAAQTDLSAADREELRKTLVKPDDARIKAFEEKLTAKLQFTELMLEVTSSIYDKYYTLAEINDLIAFYKTPTGQKVIKTMTPVMTDTMQMISERMLSKLPAILKEIQDEDRRDLEVRINARKTKPKNK